MVTLGDILTEDRILKLAGDTYFRRGLDYFERGLVKSMAEFDDLVTAEVHGTHTYQVHLWLQDGDFLHRCTCPLGADDLFCKHCVATGLAWLDQSSDQGSAPKPGTTLETVRAYLAQQSPDTLVEMILERAMEDTQWREQLTMKASIHRADGVDLRVFRSALRNAIAIHDFIDYYGAWAYADGIQTTLDSLEELLNNGYASDVVHLSEEAITLMEENIEKVDDSNGHLSPVMEDIQDLHYRACVAARPNPEALAQRLFHYELTYQWDFFYNALERYGDLLGETGRATYAQLVDEAWEKLPSIGRRYEYDAHRRRLSHMKEALVAATGSLEEQVAVISRDLSQPHRYLEIAQLYHQADQPEQAIAWAEKGKETFTFSDRLGDFLIAAYEAQQRFDDAIAIVWQDFCQSPSLRQYQRLKHQAEKAYDWPKWRGRALGHLVETIRAANTPSRRLSQGPSSTLVEIFLWEGDSEEAWQVARTSGCSKRLWMQLGELREAEHPADAVAVYQTEVEPLIEAKNNAAYGEAVALLGKIKTLMTRLDKTADFEALVSQLSTAHKRKRNFMKLLGQLE